MALPIIICDDSSFARKQIARALPKDWQVDISYAAGGSEALAAIKAGKGEVLFLDLNMPDMDGYQVLEALRTADSATMTIVVSGDIQPEAQARVANLGAVAFLRKPVNNEQLSDVLRRYGLVDDAAINAEIAVHREESDVAIKDGYAEIANVAMGRAASLLAQLLNAFVEMPIPNVNMIESSELTMALLSITDNEEVAAVCQGFIGAGIAGEALLIFTESNFNNIATLMKHEGKIDDEVRMELLMDLSNVLIGACLKGIADQLDINFSQGHPVVLGQHVSAEALIKRNSTLWHTLAIEMGFSIENQNVSGELLLLFTEDSIKNLDNLVTYLLE